MITRQNFSSLFGAVVVLGFLSSVIPSCAYRPAFVRRNESDSQVTAVKVKMTIPPLRSAGELSRFRASLVRMQQAASEGAMAKWPPKKVLEQALFKGIIEIEGIPREQIHAILQELVDPKATFCAGVSCSKVFQVMPHEVDSFLDEAYAAALKSPSLNITDRELILGSLAKNESKVTKTLVFGHRGASAFFPENSLSSVKSALSQVDGAEIDIQLTRDNKVIVLHDDTLRRTAAPWAENKDIDPKKLDAPVADLTWEDIKNVAIGPQGEKIPTLESVFSELSRHSDKRLLVEIKSYDQNDVALRQRMIQALNQAIGSLPEAHRGQVILISFDQEVLRATKHAEFLQNMERFMLLTAQQIEEAHRLGQLQEILALSREFSGLDIESGSYLKKNLEGDKNIVRLVQDQGREVVVWISRRQRTDGMHWLDVARSLGVNIFTSDLPLDILYPNRLSFRIEQAVGILNASGLSSRVKTKPGSGQGGTILLGQREWGFYAPTWADFQGLSPAELEKAVAADVAHVRAERLGLVISVADLTADEEKLVMAALKTLPPPLKNDLAIVRPDLPEMSRGISVVDVPSSIRRLQETKSLRGTRQSI